MVAGVLAVADVRLALAGNTLVWFTLRGRTTGQVHFAICLQFLSAPSSRGHVGSTVLLWRRRRLRLRRVERAELLPGGCCRLRPDRRPTRQPAWQ